MSGIIDNLTSAINTWNSKLAEIWLLLTESPETFKGGDIWQIIVKIHGALQAIGLALLVLFFVWGLIKTCTSWQDVKRPEQAFKLFLYIKILVSEQGNAVCEKLSNCHNLLIMRNDKKDYRNSQYFGFVFSC